MKVVLRALAIAFGLAVCLFLAPSAASAGDDNDAEWEQCRLNPDCVPVEGQAPVVIVIDPGDWFPRPRGPQVPPPPPPGGGGGRGGNNSCEARATQDRNAATDGYIKCRDDYQRAAAAICAQDPDLQDGPVGTGDTEYICNAEFVYCEEQRFWRDYLRTDAYWDRCCSRRGFASDGDPVCVGELYTDESQWCEEMEVARIVDRQWERDRCARELWEGVNQTTGNASRDRVSDSETVGHPDINQESNGRVSERESSTSSTRVQRGFKSICEDIRDEQYRDAEREQAACKARERQGNRNERSGDFGGDGQDA